MRRASAAAVRDEPHRACATSEAWVGASGTSAGRLVRELLAQHRHDLVAEHVELLEHGLQRQAGVVDEEQLALVVADVLADAGVGR